MLGEKRGTISNKVHGEMPGGVPNVNCDSARISGEFSARITDRMSWKISDWIYDGIYEISNGYG